MASAKVAMAEGYEDERFPTSVPENLHCGICLNVLKGAMQCEKNEHSFCMPCITRYLQNAQRCPICIEPLTIQTLRPSRFVRQLVSQLLIHCDNVDRGCPDVVKVEILDRHVASCEFSPVYCTNNSCGLLVNRRDKENHEINQCEFRKGRCEVCGLEVAYAKRMLHCYVTRAEMTLVKDTLDNFTTEMRNHMKVLEMKVKDINKRVTFVEKLLVENVGKGVQIELPDEIFPTTSQETPSEENSTVREKIYVVGGTHWNYSETFSWTTKQWANLPPMRKERYGACSFVYQGKLFVIGKHSGDDNCDIEVLDLTKREAEWQELPCKLPMKVQGHSCVVYQGNLYIFGGDSDGKILNSIYKIPLSPPYVCKLVKHMPEPRAYHGAHLFGDKVVIVGGTTDSTEDCLDSVVEFNISDNVCRVLPPLPYPVCKMGTVAWKDNIVIFGGHDGKLSDLDTVVIYNLRNGKSSMLPSMKEKRVGCCAVVTGNVIVVIGGRREVISFGPPLFDQRRPFIRELSSVEYFDFCQYKWKELPSMDRLRSTVIAVVSNF